MLDERWTVDGKFGLRWLEGKCPHAGSNPPQSIGQRFDLRGKKVRFSISADQTAGYFEAFGCWVTFPANKRATFQSTHRLQDFRAISLAKLGSLVTARVFGSTVCASFRVTVNLLSGDATVDKLTEEEMMEELCGITAPPEGSAPVAPYGEGRCAPDFWTRPHHPLPAGADQMASVLQPASCKLTHVLALRVVQWDRFFDGVPRGSVILQMGDHFMDLGITPDPAETLGRYDSTIRYQIVTSNNAVFVTGHAINGPDRGKQARLWCVRNGPSGDWRGGLDPFISSAGSS